jgi:tetratricopeptide (TPR) repeat protein
MSRRDEARQYELYHRSFADYLLSDENEDTIDGVEMHGRIAEHYWETWHDPQRSCDEYGMAYLATHLAEAEQGDRLRSLITRDWMRVRSGVGFLRDCVLAWPDLDERIAFFRRAVNEDPAWRGATRLLIHFLQMGALHDRDLGRYAESMAKGEEVNQLLEKETARQPGRWDPEIPIQRGYVAKTNAQNAWGQGDREAVQSYLAEAESCFREVVSHFQGLALETSWMRRYLSGAYNGLANVHQMRNKLNDAIEYYALATQTDPTNTFAFWDYSYLLEWLATRHGLGWIEEALQISERTVPLVLGDPSFSKTDVQEVKDRVARLREMGGEEPAGRSRLKVIVN